MTGNESLPGVLIVISAPSGAGKTSVLDEVFKRFDDISFSVSATTRKPRDGEIDGEDYYFVSNDDFDRYIEDDAFAEWAPVHGNRYGTLNKTINDSLERGGILVLDTDTVGAFNIRKRFPESVLVFIAPPSPEELRNRLFNRNTEPHEIIQKRLDAAPGEIQCMHRYDYIIINDELENAVGKLSSIIDAETAKTNRILPTLTAWKDNIDGA